MDSDSNNSGLCVPAERRVLSKAELELLEAAMLPEGVPFDVSHEFTPGVYVRTAFFPAGHAAIGHEHKFDHFNIVSKGRFLVLEEGVVREVVAPARFTSKAGGRKAAVFLEDTEWSNILPNPTNEQDTAKLEDIFVVKSETWLKHRAQLPISETMSLK